MVCNPVAAPLFSSSRRLRSLPGTGRDVLFRIQYGTDRKNPNRHSGRSLRTLLSPPQLQHRLRSGNASAHPRALEPVFHDVTTRPLHRPRADGITRGQVFVADSESE